MEVLMSVGKTIQIFLPDGSPKSIKIAEITNRTVQVILIPRAKLELAYSRKELENVGVYLLIGNPDEKENPIVYIGEAENSLNRLKQQNKAKDFWATALVIVSKTHGLTKTHIKYLEWFCYTEAEKTNRYRLENSTIPTKPHVSESMESDLLDNFETIKVLITTLGYPVFEKIMKPEKKDILLAWDIPCFGFYRTKGK